MATMTTMTTMTTTTKTLSASVAAAVGRRQDTTNNGKKDGEKVCAFFFVFFKNKPQTDEKHGPSARTFSFFFYIKEEKKRVAGFWDLVLGRRVAQGKASAPCLESALIRPRTAKWGAECQKLARGKGHSSLCARARAKTDATHTAPTTPSANFFVAYRDSKKHDTNNDHWHEKKAKKGGARPSTHKKNKEGKQEKKEG
nr:hypothetical protein [Pandoravirus belohorizontensis]